MVLNRGSLGKVAHLGRQLKWSFTRCNGKQRDGLDGLVRGLMRSRGWERLNVGWGDASHGGWSLEVGRRVLFFLRNYNNYEAALN